MATDPIVASIEAVLRRSADGYTVVRLVTEDATQPRRIVVRTKRLPCVSSLLLYSLTVLDPTEGNASEDLACEPEVFPRSVDAVAMRRLLKASTIAPVVAREWGVAIERDGAASTWAAMQRAPWFERCVQTAPGCRVWCRFDEYAFWYSMFGSPTVFDWDAAELNRMRESWNVAPLKVALDKYALDPMVLLDAVAAAAPTGFRRHAAALDSASMRAADAYQTQLLGAYHDTHRLCVPVAAIPADALGLLLEHDAVRVHEGRVYVRSVRLDVEALHAQLTRVADGFVHDAAPSAADSALDPDQLAALDCVRRHPVVLVTGAPGTGKTHVIKSIRSAVGVDEKTCVTALTGKACCNLTSRGVAARTMHSIAFRNESDPAVEALVVDEISMVDVGTLLRILPLFPNLRRVVFVGDPDQLLPVEPGAVLSIVGARLPTAALTRNHRVHAASRALAEAASSIRRGEPNVPFAPLATATRASAVLHAPWDGELDNLDAAVKGVLERVKTLWPAQARQVQFIAFTNNHAHRINRVCAATLHPHRAARGFVKGDRLCFARNLTSKGVSVSNGQIATVQGIRDRRPGRKRGRPCASTSDPRTVKSVTRVLQIDGGVELDWDAVRDAAAFGYGVTVHRAQGAEAPVVAFVLGGGNRASRRLVYTALTRASRRFILVGDPVAFRRAALHNDGVASDDGDPLFASIHR